VSGFTQLYLNAFRRTAGGVETAVSSYGGLIYNAVTPKLFEFSDFIDSNTGAIFDATDRIVFKMSLLTSSVADVDVNIYFGSVNYDSFFRFPAILPSQNSATVNTDVTLTGDGSIGSPLHTKVVISPTEPVTTVPEMFWVDNS
jgi:hypothetical protein